MAAHQVQPVLGARDAHIEQAALLFHFLRLVERAAVRQDAVVQPDDEDDAELQPLGGVQRQQGGDVAFLKVSWSETSATFSRNSDSSRWAYSSATRRSSSTLSQRSLPSSVPSSRYSL